MSEQEKQPVLRFKDKSGRDFADWEERQFSEIASFLGTTSFSRSQLNYEDGEVKTIHYGDIHTKFKTSFDITKADVPFVNSEINLTRIDENNFCREGDLIIAGIVSLA